MSNLSYLGCPVHPNVDSYYDLSEKCMLTIFQVGYEYYRVKVFVLQFLALFTEFIRTLSILRYRF